jgi:hypothetical protein
MLLIWLLPLVLLSNAVGDSTSWRQSKILLASFVADMEALHEGDVAAMEVDSWEVLNQATIAHRFSRYRLPYCVLQPRVPFSQQALLALCSAIPVLIAFAIAFAVDVTPPTWFSCRAVFNIGTMIVWVLSGGITAFLISYRSRLGKWLSIMVLTKDFLVAVPTMTLIAVSSCGYFNSCYCSSGVIWRHGSAHVDLRPDWGYAHNNVVYCTAVTTGLFAEVLFILLVCMRWRGVFRAIWWTHTEGTHGQAILLSRSVKTRAKSVAKVAVKELLREHNE